MEAYSQISMDSEDSIPKNVYEEVIVDSTIQPFDLKEDVEQFVEAPNNKNSEDISGTDEETDDDEDAESNSTSTPPLIEKDTVQNNTESVSRLSDDRNSSSLQDLKSSNLKLVLKKSPEFQIANPIVPTQASPNKIFLVTLVSNTTTGPIYSTANYSVAGEKRPVNTNKTEMEPSNGNDSLNDSKLEAIKLPTDPVKLLKTYSREIKASSNEDDNKVNIAKNFESGSKDEADIDSIKLEVDSKANTPKIKRELKQLQKTVNESKILSEYMNDYSVKVRKTRKVPLKNSSDGEGSPILLMRSRSRSCSKPRIDSPDETIKMNRWPSEEKISKRQNMRSQNAEFAQKHMKFLNSVQNEDGSDNSDGETSIIDGKLSSNSNTENQHPVAKRELQSPPKPGWDCFCFKCNSGGDLIGCTKCIRSYHAKCVKNPSLTKITNIWYCPECLAIENCLKTSGRLGKPNFTLDHLSQLLQFALKRMKQWKGSDNFLKDVSDEDYPEYSKYVVNPVTMEKLQSQIENKAYKCTEEFAVDAKWILHNSSVYFGNNTKISNIAKTIVKVCRQEVTEIDTCAECYYNANTRKDWFVEVCSKPHILLWAKLKGFPYWPAKAMGVNASLVNVRFFGDHDRAYVPIKECFLYSEKDPNPPTKQNKRSTIAECIKEVDIHIRKITAKFGSFMYPPFRTIYDPNKEIQQLEAMIPGVAELINNSEKSSKPALTYKIVKTADNHLSIIKKSDNDIESVNSYASNTYDSKDGQNNLETLKYRKKSSDSSQLNHELLNLSENAISNEKVSEKLISERERSDSSKTYEVVTKICDAEQSKVNSVILKRKSDNWNKLTPSVSKKHKTISELDLTQEQPVTSSDDHFQSTSKTTPVQPIIATIKRKRSREDNVQKVQKPKLDDDKIPPLVLLTQPYVISTANSCLVSSSTVVPSLAVVTSLNSSVTVSITQSSIASTSTVETNSNKTPVSLSSVKLFDNSEISIKRVPKKVSQTNDAVSQNEAVNNSEKDDSCISSSKEKDSSVSTNESITIGEITSGKENVSISSVDGTRKLCELIPFDEIKIERPDSDDITEFVEIRSKTATPEQPTSSKSNAMTNDMRHINFRPTIIKTELTSDDEDSSNPSRSEEIITPEQDVSLNADINNKRIAVKDMSKLCTQPVNNKKLDSVEKKKLGSKPESKRQQQRARKSFPNKSNINSAAVATGSTSLGNKRTPPQTFIPQKNLNSMVYIPVDAKTSSSSAPIQKSISTPLLTAVSKISAISSQTTITTTTTYPLTTNVSNVLVTSMPSTTLTTSIKLPIVYSTIPSSTTCPISQASTSSTQHMLSGFVTPSLASAITDTIVKGPPKLVPRPVGPFRSEGDYIFPSEAGPVCKMLTDNAHKMTDFFRSVIEDSLCDMASNNNLEAKVKLLELELEKLKFAHDKELSELKHNTDLMLCEMRTSLENEKARLIAETRKQCELERIRAVEDAKTKQWCASCGKEAQFYCCWNTSYCDYPCQQKHWTRHMNSCAQKDNSDANAQKVGVKISPFNVKEKQTKTKEPTMAKTANNFIRAHLPVAPPRNTVPTIKRLIPISTQTAPRYTLINNHEGNWGLITAPQFPRMLPASGFIMADGSSKTMPAQLPGTIIRTTKL